MDTGWLQYLSSVLAGVLHLFLGLYVLSRSPRFGIAQAFFFTMLMGFFLGFSDALTLLAEDASAAGLMARFQVFFYTLMVGGYLFLSSQLPYEDHGNWLWRYKGWYGAGVVTVGVLGALLNWEVLRYGMGWELTGEIGLGYLLFMSSTFAAGSVYLLHRTYRGSTNPEARKQCVLLAIGIFLPIVFTVLLYGLEPFLGGALDLGPLAYIVTMLLFAYGILRYKMFIIEPVMEEGLVRGEPPSVPDTRLFHCLMMEERRPDRAYQLFMDRLSTGSQGLVISRSHPDLIRERYGLERTPIIWLANQPGQDRVEPKNLSILERMVVDFLRKGERPTVILDGIEFLISENGVREVLRMLYSLSDEAILVDAMLLLPVDPHVLEESEVALFEREFELLGPMG